MPQVDWLTVWIAFIISFCTALVLLDTLGVAPLARAIFGVLGGFAIGALYVFIHFTR